MRSNRGRFVPLLGAICLQACVFYAAYGALRVIGQVNDVLTMVDASLNTIQTVLKEGRQIQRAARDGEMIAVLADRIPALVRNQLETAVTEKIDRLSKDLKTSALEFALHAVAEDLTGALRTYDRMTDTFNRFSDLMTDLSQTVPPVGQ